MASLNDAIQYAIRTLKTAGETVRKWYELTLAPPKDVQVEVYDEQGNLIQETIPNYRKQMQTLLQDKVNVPYFNGGNITNEQELLNFLQNIPKSGLGEAKITAPVKLTNPKYIGGNRTVVLEIDTDAGGQIIFGTSLNSNGERRLNGITIESSSYMLIRVKGSVPQTPFTVDLSDTDPTIPWSQAGHEKVMFKVVHSDLRVEAGKSLVNAQGDRVLFDVSADPNISFAFIARNNLYLNCGWGTGQGYIKLADPNSQYVIRLINHASFTLGIRLMDTNGNDLFVDANGNKQIVKWKNFINGILYYPTTPPVPKNVITQNDVVN